MIKLFAIDLDGTLLDSNSKMSEENIKALKDLEASGVRVVISSGRVLSSTLYQAKKISNNPVVIANNGALAGSSYDNLFVNKKLDIEILKRLYEICLDNKLSFHFYSKDTYYSNTLDVKTIDHLGLEVDYGLNYQVKIHISDDPVGEMIRYKDDPYKFLINGLGESSIGEVGLRKLLEKVFADEVYITSSYKGALEITSKNTSKVSAIYALCEKMGINIESFSAIGDSTNDKEMIKKSSLSFAMGNASDELKNIATYVVSSNDENGIVDAVKLIKECNQCLI